MPRYITDKKSLREYVTELCGTDGDDADIDAGMQLFLNHPNFRYGCDARAVEISDQDFFDAVFQLKGE